jgi:Tfp pilus assembly PilM family ATPase
VIMGFMDNLHGGGRVGIELGRSVAAAELRGDPPRVVGADHAAHAGFSGRELGDWIRRWLETVGIGGRTARAVVVEGDIYHYLVNMSEMSDSERHLAAGAQVRKLSPVPESQLAYSHMAVGYVTEGGVDKQKVLISAIDKSTMRNAVDAVEAAGLRADAVTTVPAALARAMELLPPIGGGTAIAYLSAGRSYLLVFQDGNLELVHDFALRGDGSESTADLAATELRRSFLYFGQRAQGATVQRLVLAGPMEDLSDLAPRLRESLGVNVELFDVSDHIDLNDAIDPIEQPALAVAFGAASMVRSDSGNLVSPEQVNEDRTRRAMSVGRVAAAALLVFLVGWGLLALLNSAVNSNRMAQVQEKVSQRQLELRQVRATAQERSSHAARRALLEQRSLETTLMGVVLQRISQRAPEELVIQNVSWHPVAGARGERYWDAVVEGLVLGDSRSGSQAVFNRFYSSMVSDPIVHGVHLIEPLVVGSEGARSGPAVLQQARELGAWGGRSASGGASFNRSLQPGRTRYPTQLFNDKSFSNGGPAVTRDDRDSSLWLYDQRFTCGRVASVGPGNQQPLRTTLDELPAFGPTATSVGFKVAVQLKSIAGGGQ